MTRLGLGLMVGMYNNSVSDSIEARTINELLDLPAISLDFNPQSLYRTLQSLISNGYVEYGVKAGRSYTYYLNKEGAEFVVDNDLIHPDEDVPEEEDEKY